MEREFIFRVQYHVILVSSVCICPCLSVLQFSKCNTIHKTYPPHITANHKPSSHAFDHHWPFTHKPFPPWTPPAAPFFLLASSVFTSASFAYSPSWTDPRNILHANLAWCAELSLLPCFKVRPQSFHLFLPSSTLVILWSSHAFPAHPSFRSGPNFRRTTKRVGHGWARAYHLETRTRKECIPFWDNYYAPDENGGLFW